MIEKAKTIQLVRNVKKGDEAAFTMLYDAFQKNVFFWGFYYFTDKEKALDIVQDVFTIVWKKIHSLKDDGAFYTWLRTITLNVCRNEERRDKLEICELYDFSMEQFATKESNMQNIDYHLFLDLVKRLIFELKESLRLVAFLHFIRDYEPVEIARMLDIPLGTIHSRLHRIRLDLRYLLTQNGYGYTCNEA
ncbi:hypothetical protein A4S06_02055 [Erysipelotrichaceae bacterium MTC7]|nr:hypothetical protein A4S06_02055 [Erysipelotrichaceae bacterium MTC7]